MSPEARLFWGQKVKVTMHKNVDGTHSVLNSADTPTR